MSTEYLQPKSWEELERELERLTDRSVILAGGTDLLPKIRSGKKEPDIYLSLCQLEMLGQLEDSELLTIEGLEKNGEMDAIQKAFIKKSAIQCGFCTSGMVMSAKALLLHNPTPTQEEIKRAIAGNICRCSGYREIKDAIQEAAESEMGGAT